MNIYSKLVTRANKIGFDISKVVFRGYFASPKLQLMHDKSMQTRTQLQLEVNFEINRSLFRVDFSTFETL